MSGSEQAGVPSWAELLTHLADRKDLTAAEAEWAMGEVLGGRATGAQLGALAMGLRSKGETVGELDALARTMVAHATPVALDTEAVDIVGSGGDRANTVNISTMSALAAAAAGARVVKHGNRAASSMSGTADCLEALGVRLDVDPALQQEVLDAAGICFLFAPVYHPSLRHAAGPRKEIGIRSVFNFLGPLTNPARPRAQAIGVADPRVAELMAGVLAARGSRGLVFHGGDGLDELTTTTTSRVWMIGGGRVVETVLDPADLGLQPARPADLVGGPPAHNAQVAREVLAGSAGPVRDIVVANAAAALAAHRGLDLDAALAPQLAACVADVQRVLDDGTATATLERFVAASNA